MSRIVVACDSYKGCLSSAQVNAAVREAILSLYPSCSVSCCSVADGGEGTVDAMASALGGHLVTCTVSDPLGRPVEAVYAVAGDLAVMECASCCGLSLLAVHERNPLLTSTVGLGELIMDAISRGCRRFLIGIGGSATNDGGRGMMSVPGLLEATAGCSFKVACDVDTPFVGPLGATRVFARQKGASYSDLDILEARMEAYAAEILSRTGVDVRAMPGAGAAGGLGGALAAFFGAELLPGAEMVLSELKFDDLISGADLVITGEGRSDSQTLMGKTPYGILQHCRRAAIPVALLSGSITDAPALLAAGFACLCPVTPAAMPIRTALRPAAAIANLHRAITALLTSL